MNLLTEKLELITTRLVQIRTTLQDHIDLGDLPLHELWEQASQNNFFVERATSETLGVIESLRNLIKELNEINHE